MYKKKKNKVTSGYNVKVRIKKKQKSNSGSQILVIEQSLAITKFLQDTQMDHTWKSCLIFPLSIETYKEMRTLVNRETSGFKNFL